MTESRGTFVSVSVLDSFRLVLTPKILVWSNFEIADMEFWRSEAYTKYFEYLDAAGGFYYEVCISRSHSALSNIIFSDGETLQYIH
jgi:Glycolipid 2-alpha-mannosyltransferase